MIKLIAIDIDGTLLDPERKITPEVKQAIAEAKAAGVKVVITTGRPLMGVHDILEELELTDYSDYVITYNGALVQRATGEEFIMETLEAEDVLDIDAAARKIGVHMHAITKKESTQVIVTSVNILFTKLPWLICPSISVSLRKLQHLKLQK